LSPHPSPLPSLVFKSSFIFFTQETDHIYHSKLWARYEGTKLSSLGCYSIFFNLCGRPLGHITLYLVTSPTVINSNGIRSNPITVISFTTVIKAFFQAGIVAQKESACLACARPGSVPSNAHKGWRKTFFSTSATGSFKYNTGSVQQKGPGWWKAGAYQTLYHA
jgi:hypothetical protein